MSKSKLPARVSLEYLKKLAKDRLQELRQADPHTKLATALLAVARDHGFSSWRALKAEVEQRQTENATLFIEACAKGDVEACGLSSNVCCRRLRFIRNCLVIVEHNVRRSNPRTAGNWRAILP